MENFEPLIEGFLNGNLNDEEMSELNSVLEDSRAARDEFRARVQIHGALAEHFSDSGDVRFEPIQRNSGQAPRQFPVSWIAAAAAAMIVFGGFIMVNSQSDVSIGIITDSKNAEWVGDPKTELERGYHELRAGMVEFSIGRDVNIAMEGPAKFRLIDPMRMRIDRGRFSAEVGESGHGFTVETPEGEVIDLGTRFGVLVEESGATEAHVFEGEIDVVRGGKKVRLIKDQAVDVEKLTAVSSDPLSFPMPSHVLRPDFASGDFESGEVIGSGMPGRSGVWGGDESQLSSKSEDGEVTPHSGASMLQFLSSHSGGKAEGKGQLASEIWQIVDLRAFSEQVNNGGVSAVLGSVFNRSAATLNSEFQLQFTAFRGDISKAGEFWDRKNEPTSEKLASASSSVISDNVSETWEPLEVSMAVPPGTDFLLVSLFAFENETARETKEFAGHFADSVTLKIEAKARSSRPMAVWTGEGNWGNRSGWKNGRLPDPAREGVILRSEHELVIDRTVKLKQPVYLADLHDSVGRMRIAKGGYLSQSGFGELIVGFNEGGQAELIIQGRLETRTSSYIGRNNARSVVHVDGGFWDAGDSLIRMSQYGNRGPDTMSELRVNNGGRLVAGSLELIHDDAMLEIEQGEVEVNILRIGGEDGSAAVKIYDGRLIVGELFTNKKRGLICFESSTAELLIRGKLSAAEISEIATCVRIAGNQKASTSDLVIEHEVRKELGYTLIRANF